MKFGKTGGAVATVLVIAAVAWWQRGPEPLPVLPFEPAASGSGWFSSKVDGRVPEIAAVPAEASAAASLVAASPAFWELCDLGRVPVPPGMRLPRGELPPIPAPLGRDALAAQMERVVAALRAGDPKSRLAAQMWSQPETDDAQDQATWAAGVLAEARASRDPQALRWAAHACRFVADGPSCRAELARARVQAEPANALHWLHWMQEEPDAADAAWAGLVRAQYWREAPMALATTTLAALPADTPAYLRSVLLVDALGRDAAEGVPSPQPVQQFCKEAAPGTPRHAECEHITRLFVEHGDSPLALWQGVKLARQQGWPAERVDPLAKEVQALGTLQAGWYHDEQQPLACASTEAQRRFLATVARDGELAARRAALARANAPR